MELGFAPTCEDQFLLLRNFYHMTLEAFLKIESSQFSKTMIIVFHPTHQQVTKSSQNTKIMHLAMHQPCQDQFLLLPNFSHITLEAFVRIDSCQLSKTMIFVFQPTHHQVTKSSQNSKIMHLAMHQPCQDQFLLLPNFSHMMDAFVRIESSQFFKTMIFVFHLTHHHVTKIKPKHQNHALGYAPTMPRSITLKVSCTPYSRGRSNLYAFLLILLRT